MDQNEAEARFIAEQVKVAYDLFQARQQEHGEFGELSRREQEIALVAIAFGFAFGFGGSVARVETWQKLREN